MRYAMIDKDSGEVKNIIELDENNEELPEEQRWTPPPGHRIIASVSAAIGQIWTGKHFVTPGN